MKNVYCIGEMLIDFVAEKQGKDLSKAYQFTRKAGGAPANVAAAIAKLGGQSFFVGAVGNDPFGSFLIDTMKLHQVSVDYVQQIATFTTLAFVSIAEDGERDFVFSRGADREFTYNQKLSLQFNDQLLHFGAATSFLGGNLEHAYSQYLQDAIKHQAFISFDPNYRTDLWKGNDAVFVEKCKPFIEKCHLAKFSQEEAQLLSGEQDLTKACEALHKIGAQAICITLGKEGTYVSTKNYQGTIGSIAVQPVDTTGAGDAFIGCLLKQLAEQENPETVINHQDLFFNMVKKANVCGAITTTNYGAIAALPTQEQLNSMNS